MTEKHAREQRPPAWRELFFLTIPQLGLMLCHLAVSMTDMWVAARIETSVLATLGFISQISTLLMLLISIVGSGCMATVSQALGAGRPARARRYAGLIIAISFLTGCVTAAAALLALPIVLRLGYVPAAMTDVAVVFSMAYAGQLPFFYGMIMLNSVFRAHKLVWLPFGTLALVAALNFAGSAGFGLGLWGLPKYGYAAVAWTTLFSALLGFLCNVALGIRKGILGRSSFGPWRWNRRAAPRLWRIGAPAAVGNLAAHCGSLVILTLLAGLPQGAVAAVAGMTLGSRVMAFLLFPLSALGMTVTILSGHLIGGKRFDAAYALGWRCALWSAAGLAVAAIPLAVWREPLARLFDADAETVGMAGRFLILSCCGLPFQAVTQMLNAVLAGAGATRFTCRVGCLSMWGVAVPAAWLAGRWTEWGAPGIFAGMTLGSLCAALMTVVIFRQKRWVDAQRLV